MKAVFINENGGRDKLFFDDLPEPLSASPLDPESVCIQTELAGINFIDVYMREGIYPTPHFPFILGKEGLGEIVQVGSAVTHLKIGDRVLVVMGVGTYAERFIAKASQVVKIPASLSLLADKRDLVLALGLQGFTAHYLVNDSYRIKEGDVVLVQAGAGGVGHLLIQMAKLKGAKVITTVSTEMKKKKAMGYGADHVILYKDYQFADEVMELTQGKGVEVVYDSIGQTTFDQSLKIIKPRGTMVTYGQSSGPISPFDIARLNQEGSLFLTRPSLVHFVLTREEIEWRASEVFAFIEEKLIQVEIGKRYLFSEVVQAHEDLELRKSTGKLILKVSSSR